MRIRRLERADLPALADAWEELVAHGHRIDRRFGPSAGRGGLLREYLFHTLLEVRHPFPPAWVADDGQLVGFIHGFALRVLPVFEHSPTARIADLWVRADRRRRGIGTGLVAAFVEGATAAGYPRVEVGTLALDAAAVGFWQSQGFDAWRVELIREAAYSGAVQGGSPAASMRQGSSTTSRSEKK